jgi:hypothetical protein
MGTRGGSQRIFIAGLLLLLVTHTIWPGILWLIGVTSFVGAASNGRKDRAIMSLVWWGGLALLFATHTFWPGIIVLIFLSMAFGSRGRGFGW